MLDKNVSATESTTPIQLVLWGSLSLLSIVLVAYFTFLSANQQPDDALIYLRYVRNFHDGLGLTYNPSELFNGLTSPLFTLVMILAAYLSSNLLAVMAVVSGVFFGSAALLGGHILSLGRLESAVAAVALACFGYFYLTIGMETGLYLTLIAASIILYQRESPWFLITLSLLICTRSEGVFLAIVLGLDYLLRHRRLPDWRFILAAFVIFCIPFVFNYFYYGAMMPVTGGAKIAQGRSGLWGENWIFLNIGKFTELFSGSQFAPTFLLATAFIGVIAGARQRITWLCLIYLSLLLAFYVGLNIPNYLWYYAPFLFFIVLFSCRGIFWISSLLLSKGIFSPRAVLLVLLIGGAGLTVKSAVLLHARTPQQHYVDMGNWLKENTPEGSSVAMVEIGTVGWYAQREIIDILGLVNPYNAQYVGDRQFFLWLIHYQPDYIIRHVPAWSHEQSIPPLETAGLYTRVRNVFVPGLVLLQRDPSQSKESIVQFATFVTENQKNLEQMVMNSDSIPPQLVLQGDSLFAHAPMSLRLVLDTAAESVSFGFGIRPDAQGLHHRLCFKVSSVTSSEVLDESCIDEGATQDEMHVDKTIERRLDANEELLFEIQCVDSCDYAWSYWSGVTTRKGKS